MMTPIKKPSEMAVSKGSDSNAKNYFNLNSNWCLAALSSVSAEVNWRVLTNNPPTAATIVSYGADRYFEVPPSSLDCMVINLLYDINPSHYSWPVYGLDVVLVECQLLELQMIELCRQYGASTITLQEHTLQPYTPPQIESLGVAA